MSSTTDDVRLNVLEEFGTRPNVMNLLLFSVIAAPAQACKAILVSSAVQTAEMLMPQLLCLFVFVGWMAQRLPNHVP